MKPKTILQRRVAELADGLYSISQAEKEWAYNDCLEHKAFATKSRVLCLDCGETFPPALVSRKRAVCPHCSAKVKVEESRCTTAKQHTFFAITELVNEFQVIRNFELIAYYKKGCKVRYYLHEILQNWIREDFKTTFYGKQHSVNGYCDSWGGDMEIREENNRSYYRNKYDVYPQKYHPNSVIKREYSKFGIDHNLSGLSFLEAIRFIPNNPKLETLLKAKQYSLLSKGESYQINTYWASIKICLRNKYKVADVISYFDYLELLRYFKKDLRNAKYVCPKNLKKEHDKLVKKKREIQRLEDQDRDRKRVIERQLKLEKATIEFVQRISKFCNIEFKDGPISIQLLKTIDEFKEEGDELHHCVYTNEYYLREKSLLFSARVDGKRTETIELTVDKMKIDQSRGLGNKPSDYNKEIVQLMNKSIPKIRAIFKKSLTENKLIQKLA